MENPQFTWGTSNRYNSFSGYFVNHYGERIQKLSVDLGLTCPNRDGSKSTGGCIYCNNDAFNPSYCLATKSVTQQITEGIEFHIKRYRRATKYLAYFQTYSNTYASLETLKEKFNEALAFPGVVGLVIATRPDCVDEEKLQYLAEINTSHPLFIEYGVESCYNKSLDFINRQHSYEESMEAIKKTADCGIKTGVHLIFGLPTETREEMLLEAEMISTLPVFSIKLHQLQIIKNTRLAEDYQKNPAAYNLFELPEYIDFVIDFAERLNPTIIIERFTAEVPPRYLIGPDWGLVRTDQIINQIHKRFEERNTWQGRLYNAK